MADFNFMVPPDSFNKFASSFDEINKAMASIIINMSSVPKPILKDDLELINISLVTTPVDKNCTIKIHGGVEVGQVFTYLEKGHRVAIKNITLAKEGPSRDIIEYDYTDFANQSEGYTRERASFKKYWAKEGHYPSRILTERLDIREPKLANKNDIDICKGQIRANTLGVFEVAAVFKGRMVNDQIYLRCLSSIHPSYEVGEIYWEYPQFIESRYRLIKKEKK